MKIQRKTPRRLGVTVTISALSGVWDGGDLRLLSISCGGRDAWLIPASNHPHAKER